MFQLSVLIAQLGRQSDRAFRLVARVFEDVPLLALCLLPLGGQRAQRLVVLLDPLRDGRAESVAVNADRITGSQLSAALIAVDSAEPQTSLEM